MQFNPSVHRCLAGRPWLRDEGILPHADRPTPRRGAPDYTRIHSAATLHPKDTETTLDESSRQKKKTSLFPPIIESSAEEEEEAKLQNIKNNGIWQNAWSWPLSEGDGLISE